MKIFTTIIMSLLCMLPILCNSQNITTSTLSWRSEEMFNIATGDLDLKPSAIVSNANQSVDWKNADGSVKEHFEVKEIIGNWNNVSQNGEIVYEIGNAQHGGSITFSKKNLSTKIKIVLTGEAPGFYEFTIESVTAIP